MINANDYNTIEELSDAMQLERDISELDSIRKSIATLEINLTIINQRYSEELHFLHKKESKIKKSIDEYWARYHRKNT